MKDHDRFDTLASIRAGLVPSAEETLHHAVVLAQPVPYGKPVVREGGSTQNPARFPDDRHAVFHNTGPNHDRAGTVGLARTPGLSTPACVRPVAGGRIVSAANLAAGPFGASGGF